MSGGACGKWCTKPVEDAIGRCDFKRAAFPKKGGQISSTLFFHSKDSHLSAFAQTKSVPPGSVRAGDEAMSLLSSLVGSAARIVVNFADVDRRQTVTVRQPDGKDQEQYLFSAGDNISGSVPTSRVACPPWQLLMLICH
jgi:hypothetical protein